MNFRFLVNIAADNSTAELRADEEQETVEYLHSAAAVDTNASKHTTLQVPIVATVRWPPQSNKKPNTL